MSNTNKFYPPQIEGTIPACYLENDSIQLIVPFMMNKTVSYNDIYGFKIKIKSVQNNEVVYQGESIDFSSESRQVKFVLPKNKLILGMFYKVQIAYISISNTLGYYSNVGIMKYTSKPQVSILELDNHSGELKGNANIYTGYYSQYGQDTTEKVYSYNFTVYDDTGTIFDESGELLHNHENDDERYETKDQYQITKFLQPGKVYTIVYTVTTTNGLVVSSQKYRVYEQTTIPPEFDAEIVAFMNEENAYVELRVIGNKNELGQEKSITGTFIISRSSSEDNYSTWSEITRFALYGERSSYYKWKDFTIQHGYTYRYSLQQYNIEHQIYSNRLLSNDIIANFEHSFLYDGVRQLKIKYNPKVSSIKENMLEQKTNTLGGKYPFFFRNSNVRYKEFPIAGLISYISDEEELFLTDQDLQLNNISHLQRQYTINNDVSSNISEYFENYMDINMSYKLQQVYSDIENDDSQENRITYQRTRTSDLTDYNILAERIFKNKVMEFLNDGKPKIFKSPAEGNFLVRLTNTSFSPEDKLNRMLHNFSTTAVEIDDYNYQKLNEYGLISVGDPVIKQLRWKTVMLYEAIQEDKTNKDSITIGELNNIYSIQCLDMAPGDKITLYFSTATNDYTTLVVGVTGAYYAKFAKPIYKVEIPKTIKQGQITYSYYGSSFNYFDTYQSIISSDIPLIQLGDDRKNEKIMKKEILNNINNTYEYIYKEPDFKYKDIRERYGLEDLKFKVIEYYFLNFSKIMPDSDYDLTKYDYSFYIDDKQFNISDSNGLTIGHLDKIPEIILSNGVKLDISIQRREIVYDVESKNPKVKSAKNDYIQAKNKVENLIYNGNTIQNNMEKYENELSNAKNDYYITYKNFLSVLKTALDEKGVLKK